MRQKKRTGRAALVALLLGGAALLSVATSASPPAIDRITPDLGSSSVPTDEPLTVELERPVNPDTVTADTVRLRRVADDQQVEATLELADGNQRVILRPAAPLAPQADYTLELNLATLRDTDGNAYAGLRYDESLSAVWETAGLLRVPFTTRRTLTVGRAFLSADPDELLVYFSEAVDADRLTVQAVTLTNVTGPVPIDLRYSAAHNRLRVVFLAPLAPGQRYTLRLAPAITTPDGAPLAAGLGEALDFHTDDERIR